MSLDQGAISKAILRAAGDNLQTAILNEARVDQLAPGSLVVTDAFKLTCQKVFHTVCPPWSSSGQAEKVSCCSRRVDVSQFFRSSHLWTFRPRR